MKTMKAKQTKNATRAKSPRPAVRRGGGPEDRDRRRVVGAGLKALAGRANAGDRQALAGLRCMMDEHPEIWQHIGDLGGLCRADLDRGDRR